METIEIRQGDSSEFFYQIEVTLDTEEDLTGWVGYFQVGTLEPIKYPDISSKSLEISIGNSLTSKLRPGQYTGYLKLIKPSGITGTLEPIIGVKIIPEVVNFK